MSISVLNCHVKKAESKKSKQNKKYLQTSQRCQAIKYAIREAAQFVAVQPSAIYFIFFYFKAVKIFLNTKK